MLEIKFSYKDRVGQLVSMEHTYNTKVLNTRSDVELLIETFKSFLLSTGFPIEEIEMAEQKVAERKSREESIKHTLNN